jgi:Na+/proline symporter
MLFNPKVDAELRTGPAHSEYLALEQKYRSNIDQRSAAARAAVEARATGDPARVAQSVSAFQSAVGGVEAVRADAVTFAERHTAGARYNDVNYVFPTFITQHMPIGFPGLLVAAILAAAMSAIGGELSSLSTATVIDFYRRFVRAEASDAHYLGVSRVATAFWGLFASIVAVWAAELGSLIEVVNRFGSFFYGSILGVFILAVGFPRATANGAFIGLVAGMGAVAWAASATNVAFLWHNVIGAVTVVIVGLAVSMLLKR